MVRGWPALLYAIRSLWRWRRGRLCSALICWGFWDADLCSDRLVILWLGFQTLCDSFPGGQSLLGKGFGLDIGVWLLIGLESGDAGA